MYCVLGWVSTSDLKKWLSEWGKHRIQQVGEGRALAWTSLRLPGDAVKRSKGCGRNLRVSAHDACPCPLAARMETKSQDKSDTGVTKVKFDVASPFAWIETKIFFFFF